MSNEDYKGLRKDLLEGHQTAMNLYQRTQDWNTRWAQWQERQKKALESGESLPPFWEDETHNALIAEMQNNLSDLQTHLHRPKLNPETTRRLRQQMSPEEKAQLRQQLFAQLKAAPPEILSSVAETFDQVIEKTTAEHGTTPNLDATLEQIRSALKPQKPE